MVAFTWLCDLARRHCADRDAAWLAGLGLLLFLVNPWMWATISFDVHEEPLVIFFAVFLAWDVSRGKRRAWVWAVPVLLGGAPTTTYVIGIGLGGVLAGRQTRTHGVPHRGRGHRLTCLPHRRCTATEPRPDFHIGYIAKLTAIRSGSLEILWDWEPTSSRT